MNEFTLLKNFEFDTLSLPDLLRNRFARLNFDISYAKSSENNKYCVFWNSEHLLFLDWEKGIKLTQYKGTDIANCWITNTGILLVEDWSDSSLNGKITIFNGQEKLFTRSFKANILNTGLSPDGKYAAVQLLRSNNAHSNQLYVYDIPNKKRYTIHKGYIDSDTYAFSENKIMLDLKKFKAIYDISTGNFVGKINN